MEDESKRRVRREKDSSESSGSGKGDVYREYERKRAAAIEALRQKGVPEALRLLLNTLQDFYTDYQGSYILDMLAMLADFDSVDVLKEIREKARSKGRWVVVWVAELVILDLASEMADLKAVGLADVTPERVSSWENTLKRYLASLKMDASLARRLQDAPYNLYKGAALLSRQSRPEEAYPIYFLVLRIISALVAQPYSSRLMLTRDIGSLIDLSPDSYLGGVRESGIRVLEEITDEKQVEHLVRFVEKGILQEAVLKVLERVKDRVDATLFLPLLESRDSMVRLTALKAIKTIDDPKVEPYLIPLLEDKDKGVREEAERVLKTLRVIINPFKQLVKQISDQGFPRKPDDTLLGEIEELLLTSIQNHIRGERLSIYLHSSKSEEEMERINTALAQEKRDVANVLVWLLGIPRFQSRAALLAAMTSIRLFQQNLVPVKEVLNKLQMSGPFELLAKSTYDLLLSLPDIPKIPWDIEHYISESWESNGEPNFTAMITDALIEVTVDAISEQEGTSDYEFDREFIKEHSQRAYLIFLVEMWIPRNEPRYKQYIIMRHLISFLSQANDTKILLALLEVIEDSLQPIAEFKFDFIEYADYYAARARFLAFLIEVYLQYDLMDKAKRYGRQAITYLDRAIRLAKSGDHGEFYIHGGERDRMAEEYLLLQSRIQKLLNGE